MAIIERVRMKPPRIDLTPPPAPIPLWRRLAWLALIWTGSVAALGVVAFAIRAMIRG